MSVYYSFFKRQWKRCSANEQEIDEAINRGYLTESEGQEIKDIERDCE